LAGFEKPRREIDDAFLRFVRMMSVLTGQHFDRFLWSRLAQKRAGTAFVPYFITDSSDSVQLVGTSKRSARCWRFAKPPREPSRIRPLRCSSASSAILDTAPHASFRCTSGWTTVSLSTIARRIADHERWMRPSRCFKTRRGYGTDPMDKRNCAPGV